MFYCGPTGNIVILKLTVLMFAPSSHLPHLIHKATAVQKTRTPAAFCDEYILYIYILCPHTCWEKKNCLNVHFKGFSIIKGSISLRWKLHCWFEHPAASSSPSERSSHDDICSNHWVMSLTNIKSPTSRCKKLSKKQSYRVGNRLPGWVMSRRRKHLTLPSMLSHC